MLPREIRAKRIELLKQIEILEQTPGNDKQIRAIGDKLLKLTNDRKSSDDKSTWKEDLKPPANFPLTVEEYTELVREGLSDNKIIKRIGTSLSTLQRWKIANNINKHDLKHKLKLEDSK